MIDLVEKRIAQIRERIATQTSDSEDLTWALDKLESALRALAATIRAKQENDERFMLERDQARIEHDELAARIEHVKALTRMSNNPRDTEREIAYVNGANSVLEDVKDILNGGGCERKA